jgi:hypothetical protein
MYHDTALFGDETGVDKPVNHASGVMLAQMDRGFKTRGSQRLLTVRASSESETRDRRPALTTLIAVLLLTL